jgi:hypothetical protein
MGAIKDIYDIAKDLGLLAKLVDRSYLVGVSRRLVDYEKLLTGANNFVYCLGLTWKSF